MKKSFFMLLAAVLLSSVSAFAQSDNNANGGYVFTQTINTSKTLIVVLDNALPAGAKLTYGGNEVTPSGLTYIFDNVLDGQRLELKKGTSNLVASQSAIVNFGDKNVVVMNVNITLESAGTTITTAAEGATDDDRVDDFTTGTVMISAAAAAKAGIIGMNLSATMFAPLKNSLLKENEIMKDANYMVTPYALSCQPDGAVFTPEKVGITAFLEKGAGCEVEIIDPSTQTAVSDEIIYDTGDDATLTAMVTHFSIWDIIMKLQITGVEDGEEVILSKELPTGTTDVSFKEWFGYNFVGQTWVGNNIITRTFNALFGSTETAVNKNFSFAEPLETPMYIELKQKYKTVTLKSGNQTFVVKVWGTLMPAKIGTDIREVTAERSTKGDGNVYDLSGRRVTPTGKGVYIVGGRKVLK